MPNVLQLNIIDKIAEMLKRIQKSNGFLCNVDEVNKQDVSPENIREFPAINISTGPTTYVNPTNSEAGRLVKTIEIILDVYIKGKEDKEIKLANLLADIEKTFFRDEDTDPPNRIYAYNLERQCNIVIPVSCYPFNVIKDEHLYGFQFTMQVKFRQSRNDPTVLY